MVPHAGDHDEYTQFGLIQFMFNSHSIEWENDIILLDPTVDVQYIDINIYTIYIVTGTRLQHPFTDKCVLKYNKGI